MALQKLIYINSNDLFREKSGDIVINQHNTDNKDGSINGIVLPLTDKEAVNQLVEIMKERLDGLKFSKR